MNLIKLKAQLKAKIQILDKEEGQLGEQLNKGCFKTDKRKRQKNCIRCLYLVKIQAFLGLLNVLGGEDKFVKEVWKRREKHYNDSYEDVYKSLRAKDYPKDPFLEL